MCPILILEATRGTLLDKVMLHSSMNELELLQQWSFETSDNFTTLLTILLIDVHQYEY